MLFGASVWSLLVGVLGGVLFVCAVLLGGRLGARRSMGAAGAGLLLLGLSVSGVVGILAQALAVGLNPVRWIGLGAGALGVVMLSSAGMLPGRGRRRGVADEESRALGRGQTKSKSQTRSQTPGQGKDQAPAGGPVDDDLAEIEDILRRRGIE